MVLGIRRYIKKPKCPFCKSYLLEAPPNIKSDNIFKNGKPLYLECKSHGIRGFMEYDENGNVVKYCLNHYGKIKW